MTSVNIVKRVMRLIKCRGVLCDSSCSRLLLCQPLTRYNQYCLNSHMHTQYSINRTLKVAQSCLVKLEMIDVHVGTSGCLEFLCAALWLCKFFSSAVILSNLSTYMHVYTHAYTHATLNHMRKSWLVDIISYEALSVCECVIASQWWPQESHVLDQCKRQVFHGLWTAENKRWWNMNGCDHSFQHRLVYHTAVMLRRWSTSVL